MLLMNSAYKISAEATAAVVTNHWRGKIKMLNFQMKSVVAEANRIFKSEFRQKTYK